MRIAALIAASAASYVVGSLPTAYLLVKWLKRVDVRTIGSGNVGATNAARVAGPSVGAAVFLIDLAKGAIAGGLIAPWLLGAAASPAARLGCGLLAVIGHTVPFTLNFRGGKGVATTIGVLLSTMPAVAGIAAAVWLVTVLLCRYVSVGSLAAAVTIPLAQMATRRTLPEVWLGAILALLIVLRHRRNVERLVQGVEPRVPMRGRV